MASMTGMTGGVRARGGSSRGGVVVATGSGRLRPVSARANDSDAWNDLAGARRDVPLADMIDRSASQLVVLRRTLDEAQAIDAEARQLAADLQQRHEQGRRTAHELDLRLAAAGRSAGTLEQASMTLRGLEQLVEQMRELSAGAEKRFEERLALAQSAMEERVKVELDSTLARIAARAGELESRLSATLDASAEHARAIAGEYERRMEAQRQAHEARLAELSARIEDSAGKVEGAHQRVADHIAQAWDRIDRELSGRSQELGARLDRQAAATQARVSMILDSASDRAAVLESQAARASGELSARVTLLCEQAVRVLGYDPSSERCPEPRPGSLAHEAARVSDLVRDCVDTSGRLAALCASAGEATQRVHEAVEASNHAATQRELEARRIGEVFEQGQRRLAEFDESLRDAEIGHQAALARVEDARRTLQTIREDLDTMAAAAQYHAQSVRENESRLEEARARADASSETARVRAAALERAMSEVTQQAESMVALARDVAALLERGERVRSAHQAA